jgi:catechol 2,3-dioxygenase-like lactoylglutathione lyase family enzyme
MIPAVTADLPTEGMELTHLLVVDDLQRSRAFYLQVLGAERYREYGGTSVVLRLFGTWLLLLPRPRRPPAGDQRGAVGRLTPRPSRRQVSQSGRPQARW